MAKRQNFIVGSTNAVTQSLTTSELNHAFDQYEILTADELDGVFNAVSDYSNDSSNEIANAIQSITGSQPTGANQSELANALQQMRSEIETTSLTFKGYVATSAPSSSTYTLVEGNLWINSATMPTSFPIAASSIKKWDGSAWVNYGSTYTPADFDFFRNINDNEGYYWFGGVWTVMSTDMDTNYFQLNAQGKWTIKNIVTTDSAQTIAADKTFSGTTKVPTAAASTNDTTAASTAFVKTVAPDKSLSNLTSAGKNISNWSTNQTNCVVEIPQDIKLELSSGILTLKAGSKAYLPDGTTYSASQDVVLDTAQIGTATADWVVAMTGNNVIFPRPLANSVSGAGATTVSGYAFNTTTNVISWYNSQGLLGGTNCSFPIAIIHTTSGTPDRITHIFNGFGWIGTKVFVLPGVKALVPNGRNADGTLKNTTITMSGIKLSDSYNSKYIMSSRGITPASFTNYAEQETQPSFSNGIWYQPSTNIMYGITNGVVGPTGQCYVLQVFAGSGVSAPTGINIKQAFRAADYNDLTNMIDMIYPVGSVYIGTQSSCPLAVVLPNSVWTLVSAGKALWTGNGTSGSGSTSPANYNNAPANTTIAAGLPNITGTITSFYADKSATGTGALSTTRERDMYIENGGAPDQEYNFSLKLDASQGGTNAVYGKSSTVQPPAYVVNVWRRTK